MQEVITLEKFLDIQCPFIGTWEDRQTILLALLALNDIAQQPIKQVTVQWTDGSYTIEAGQGKYWGLAFINYCWRKYRSPHVSAEHPILTVNTEMAVEALLFFGQILWEDTSKHHPALHLFKMVLRGEVVTVKIDFQPVNLDHNTKE